MSYKEHQKKVVEGKKKMFFLLIRAVFLTYETIAGKMTAQLRVDVCFVYIRDTFGQYVCLSLWLC